MHEALTDSLYRSVPHTGALRPTPGVSATVPVPDGQGPHMGIHWLQRAWGQDGRRSTDPIPSCSLLAGLKVKKAKSIPPESLSSRVKRSFMIVDRTSAC